VGPYAKSLLYILFSSWAHMLIACFIYNGQLMGLYAIISYPSKWAPG